MKGGAMLFKSRPPCCHERTGLMSGPVVWQSTLYWKDSYSLLLNLKRTCNSLYPGYN